MPSAQSILDNLTEVANNWQALALAWHIYFAIVALAVISGLRPSRRVASLILALPVLSVSALSWSNAMAFTGTTFALSGAILVYVAMRLRSGHIEIAPWWMVVPGAAMFLFGWAYPHFLEGGKAFQYLYAAPTGLVPCPTLSIVIGATLILNGLRSLAWTLVLIAMGLFYGAFGVLYVSVGLDLVLFLGALILSAQILYEPFRGG